MLSAASIPGPRKETVGSRRRGLRFRAVGNGAKGNACARGPPRPRAPANPGMHRPAAPNPPCQPWIPFSQGPPPPFSPPPESFRQLDPEVAEDVPSPGRPATIVPARARRWTGTAGPAAPRLHGPAQTARPAAEPRPATATAERAGGRAEGGRRPAGRMRGRRVAVAGAWGPGPELRPGTRTLGAAGGRCCARIPARQSGRRARRPASRRCRPATRRRAPAGAVHRLGGHGWGIRIFFRSIRVGNRRSCSARRTGRGGHGTLAWQPLGRGSPSLIALSSRRSAGDSDSE
jgi:hypothetical protein